VIYQAVLIRLRHIAVTLAVKAIMLPKRKAIGRTRSQAPEKQAARTFETIERREPIEKTVRSRCLLHADLNFCAFRYDCNYGSTDFITHDSHMDNCMWLAHTSENRTIYSCARQTEKRKNSFFVQKPFNKHT